MTEGATVYDPRTEPHHHLLDEATGRIHDPPWDALEARRLEVRALMVGLRGTLRD